MYITAATLPAIWWRGRVDRAESRNEERHEGEGRHVDEEREADRRSEREEVTLVAHRGHDQRANTR